ncbi:MAG: radical SAM protein [Desulfobulbus sp.]|nr:radical SAM protein [Desulfobulbus sp.]
MNFLFGPVNSRRLGRSLGIDLFREKICNLNCVYCEVGPTTVPVNRRGRYSPTREILAEITEFCSDPHRLAAVDVLTVTAKGEPTLHLDLGVILRHIKSLTDKPVAVLTNGTTLADDEVREALQLADIVVPSLDAVRAESFSKVDRPARGLTVEAIINGLRDFSRAYRGRLWLEILLVRDINDADADIDALLPVLTTLRLDRIQLNTVVRPPADPGARPVAEARLAEIARRLQAALAVPVDLPSPVAGFGDERDAAPLPTADAEPAALRQAIIQMVRRRPCTAADIDRVFHLGGAEKVEQLLASLVASGTLRILTHAGDRFYH